MDIAHSVDLCLRHERPRNYAGVTEDLIEQSDMEGDGILGVVGEGEARD